MNRSTSSISSDNSDARVVHTVGFVIESLVECAPVGDAGQLVERGRLRHLQDLGGEAVFANLLFTYVADRGDVTGEAPGLRIGVSPRIGFYPAVAAAFSGDAIAEDPPWTARLNRFERVANAGGVVRMQQRLPRSRQKLCGGETGDLFHRGRDVLEDAVGVCQGGHLRGDVEKQPVQGLVLARVPLRFFQGQFVLFTAGNVDKRDQHPTRVRQDCPAVQQGFDLAVLTANPQFHGRNGGNASRIRIRLPLFRNMRHILGKRVCPAHPFFNVSQIVERVPEHFSECVIHVEDSAIGHRRP